MKKTAALLLALAVIFALCACGAAPADVRKKYPVQENTAENKATYPYVVQTDSATWYLSGDDIALLGEEAFYDGFYSLLEYQEADFAAARDALAGYIRETVPPVDIYTDFCEKAGISQTGGAYYNPRRNFIKVFNDWEKTKYTLVHEYVHYLTVHCTDTPITHSFFGEAIAEYVSKLMYPGRLLQDFYRGMSEEEMRFFRERGAWNEAEDRLDLQRYYIGSAQVYAMGVTVGQEYLCAADQLIVRTQEIQDNPTPENVSHFEAACILAYLIETYSRETVLSHLDMDPADLEQVYGEPFSAVYRHWFAWNTERCDELGLIL